MKVTFKYERSYDSFKTAVRIYDGVTCRTTLWFREAEEELAEQCFAEAVDLPACDDDTLAAFRYKWSAIRADHDTTPFGRPQGKRAVLWHTETP